MQAEREAYFSEQAENGENADPMEIREMCNAIAALRGQAEMSEEWRLLASAKQNWKDLFYTERNALADMMDEVESLRLRVEDDPNAPGYACCQRSDCLQILKNSNDAMGENTALRHQLAHAVHDYESRTRPCAKKHSPEGCEFCPPKDLHG